MHLSEEKLGFFLKKCSLPALFEIVHLFHHDKNPVKSCSKIKKKNSKISKNRDLTVVEEDAIK